MNRLYSAICVSHSSRFGLLQRSVLNYLAQTVPGFDSELLILVHEEGYADRIRSFLKDRRVLALIGLNEGRPISVQCYPNVSPTELAFYGFANARGELLVAWDDDNLSHPDRLALQFDATEDRRATALSHGSYYFHDTDELFYTGLHQPSGKFSERCFSGSLVISRGCVPQLDLGNRDTPWAAQVVDRLGQKMLLDLVDAEHHLFLAGSNGDNLRGIALHRRLGSRLPLTLSRDTLTDSSAVVELDLKGYSFHQGEVEVCGKDAAAFRVTGLPKWPDWLASPLAPADWHDGIPSRSYHEHVAAERQEQEALRKSQQEGVK